MATPCSIVLRRDERWYEAIKVGFSGGINDAGRILLEHYNTLEAVEKLIAGGDCSHICENVEDITRSGRPSVRFETTLFSEKNCWGYYTYLFDAYEGDGWSVSLSGYSDTRNGSYFHFASLSDAIEIEDIDSKKLALAIIEASFEKTLDDAGISYRNSVDGKKSIYKGSKKVYEIDLVSLFDLSEDETISLSTCASSFYEIVGSKIDDEMMEIIQAVEGGDAFLSKDDYGDSVFSKLSDDSTELICGEDRAVENVALTTYYAGEVENRQWLNPFIEELILKLSKCPNISIGFYDAKKWLIVPRYFDKNFGLYWFKSINWNMLKLNKISSLKDWCKQSFTCVYTTDYAVTVSDKLLDKETKRAELAIQNMYRKFCDEYKKFEKLSRGA